MYEMYMVQLGEKKYYIEVTDALARIQNIEAEFDDLPDFDEEEGVSAYTHTISAPLPANVCQVLVQQGQRVRKDALLFLCEAMKMELEIRAPMGGTVTQVNVQVGQHIEKGESLGQLAPEE